MLYHIKETYYIIKSAIMVKRIMYPLIICIMFLLLGNYNASAQSCNAMAFEKSNILRLSKNFTHKHTFDLSKASSKGEIEKTYIFSKGKLYMLNVSNFKGQEKNIIVELFDQNGVMVATNYNSTTNRFWPIGYVCKESGVHVIKFRYINTTNYCGICVVGAK